MGWINKPLQRIPMPPLPRCLTTQSAKFAVPNLGDIDRTRALATSDLRYLSLAYTVLRLEPGNTPASIKNRGRLK